jgi:hypothetical protein
MAALLAEVRSHFPIESVSPAAGSPDERGWLHSN